MPATVGTSGFGTLLKRGDGGVGAGTQASKTVGTSNQQIVAKARTAGTAGNSMQFGIVVSGNNTVFSFTISSTSLVITSATDGAGVATTTVDDAIVAIQNDATYRTYWELTTGVGNGSGVLVASATSALSGGTNGAEVFTTIAEVTNIAGPEIGLELIDATHMESTNAYREYIPSLLDAGEVTLDVNFLPQNTTHKNVIADVEARVRRNFQMVWTDSSPTTWAFAAYVTKFAPSAQIDDRLMAAITLKVSGAVTRTP